MDHFNASGSGSHAELYDIERKRVRKIFEAAASGDAKSLESALGGDEKASILEFKDSNSRNALHFAASQGHSEVVCAILGYLKDDTARAMGALAEDINGDTPLSLCIRSGHVDVAKVFFEYDVDLCTQKGNKGSTLLHDAAKSGHVPMLKLLLSRPTELVNSEVNFCSNSGTPLFWTAFNNDTESTKLLLSAGGDPDLCDEEGRTPMLVAAACDAAEVVAELVKFGASLMAKCDGNDTSVLHTAAEVGAINSIKEILKRAPKEKVDAALKLRSMDGFTPEEIAAFAGHLETVEVIGNFSGRSQAEIECILTNQQEKRKNEEHASQNEWENSHSACENFKVEGNSALESGNFDEALGSYTAGISVAEKLVDFCERVHARLSAEASSERLSAAKKINAILFCNRCACYLKLSERLAKEDFNGSRLHLQNALTDAEKATTLLPTWPKTFLRLGQAFAALGQHADAAQAFWTGYEIDTSSPTANAMLSLFKKEVKAGKEAAGR